MVWKKKNLQEFCLIKTSFLRWEKWENLALYEAFILAYGLLSTMGEKLTGFHNIPAGCN